MNLSSSQRRLLLILSVAFGIALYALSLPLVARRQQYTCQSNLKQLALATFQYARDYDEKLMMAPIWKEELKPYMSWSRVPGAPKLFYCPKTERDYALNVGLNQMILAASNHPEKLAMYYEPSRPTNADNGALWPKEGVHGAGSNVCFLDGHAKLLETKPSFWSPELNPYCVPPPKATPKPKAKAPASR